MRVARSGPDALERIPILPRIYYALLATDERLAPDEDARIDCGEFVMWVNPSKSGFGRDIYHHGRRTNELDFEHAFRTLCFDGMCFLDVGSHWGYYVVLADAVCDPSRLVAFEPEPSNVELLRRNIEANDIDAELVTAAVSDTTSDTVGWDPNEDLESGSLTAAADADTSEPERTVQSVTLTDYLDRNDVERVDLMKIDVEGAEGRVFSGLEGAWGRVDGIALELHTNRVTDFGDDPEQILATLLEEGYDVVHLDNTGGVERIDSARLEGMDVRSELAMTPRTVHVLLAVRPGTNVARRFPDDLSSLVEAPQ